MKGGQRYTDNARIVYSLERDDFRAVINSVDARIVDDLVQFKAILIEFYLGAKSISAPFLIVYIVTRHKYYLRLVSPTPRLTLTSA